MNEIQSTRMKIYEVILKELEGDKFERLDYNEIARTVACSRSTVRYHIGALLKRGILGIRDGKLFVRRLAI